MRDTELAEIRARLVAMAAVKAPPPKPSLLGRLKARAPQAKTGPYVGAPSPPRPEPRRAEPSAPPETEVEAASAEADLPYFPPEPLRRSAFGQRADTPEEPPLLLAHPVEPEPAPAGAVGLQRRLSAWLSTEQAYEVPAYAQEQPVRRESDLRIAAELAETPYEPEDLGEEIAPTVEDTTLADDLALALAAVEQVAAIVEADVTAPAPAKRKPAPRRVARSMETPAFPEANEHGSGPSDLLARLHQTLLIEQRRVDELLSSLAEPTALAA